MLPSAPGHSFGALWCVALDIRRPKKLLLKTAAIGCLASERPARYLAVIVLFAKIVTLL